MFEHVLVVAPEDTHRDAAARVAAGLTAAFNGTVAATTARCEADLARERASTLVVVARPAPTVGLPGRPVEHWLRHCRLPMLFVPGL